MNHQQTQAKQQTDVPVRWPFATYNSQRTQESQSLLNKKNHKRTKSSVSDVEDALF